MLVRRAGSLRRLVAIACMAAAALSPARAQDATPPPAANGDSLATDLGPATAPPWNAPTAESGQRLWETLVQLPGRVVTLPLSAIGYGTRNYLLFVEGTNLVPRTVAVIAGAPRFGVYVTPASLGDHTGTGVALQVRPPKANGIISGELSASTQHYHRTRIQLTLGPFGADYLYEWRPRDQFFGLGPDSRTEDLSEYATQDQSVRAQVAWPVQKRKQPPPRAQAMAYVGTRQLVTR